MEKHHIQSKYDEDLVLPYIRELAEFTILAVTILIIDKYLVSVFC